MKSYLASLCLVVCSATAHAAPLVAPFTSPAAAAPVSGLIVQLQPAAASAGRESPLAAESRSRERMAAVAQGAGVAMHSQRALGPEQRLMRFASGLQGAALDDAVRRLRLHPEVAWVEPNVRFKRANTVPNDAQFAQQWHLGLSSANAGAVNLPLAWDRTTGGNQVVAVLDTGVRPGHPDLVGKLLPGYDFIEDVENANDGNGRDADPTDPGDWVTTAEANSATFAGCTPEPASWHGTFIAGQIAAATNNASGVAGVNWGAKILPVRVSGKCGALLSDILDGMRWAAGLPVAGVPNNPNPARILNLSFGGDVACTPSYQAVINEVRAVGALLVVSAGNRTSAGDNMQLKRPADCAGVLAVGAVQTDGAKTAYSYIGTSMGLMAPGGHGSSPSTLLLSLDNTGVTSVGVDTYGTKAGTSFSAPLAAGVASLMLAINPAITPDGLIARLRAGARPHAVNASLPSCSSAPTAACNCTTSVCGAGMLDAFGAVQQAYAPAAVIASVGAPAVGANISLDGRASSAISGASIVAYRWSVVSGAGLAIQNAAAAQTSVQLPAAAGSFVFMLSVTDSAGLVGQETLTVVTAAPVAAASSGGGGGGATPWFWVAGLYALLALLLIKKTRVRRGIH